MDYFIRMVNILLIKIMYIMEILSMANLMNLEL